MLVIGNDCNKINTYNKALKHIGSLRDYFTAFKKFRKCPTLTHCFTVSQEFQTFKDYFNIKTKHMPNTEREMTINYSL